MADERSGNAPPVVVAGAPRTGTTWIASVLARRPGVAWVNEPDNEWPNPYTLRAKLRLGRFPVLTGTDQVPRAYVEVWRRALAGLAESPRRQQVAWKLDRGEPTALELWRAMCDHASPAVSARLRVLVATSAPPSHRVPGADVLVKSVFAPLALEWLAAAFAPRIVVVLRHPLNVLSSWVSLGWGGCALEANPRVRAAFGERWGLPTLADEASPLARIAWEVGLFTTALQEAAGRTDLVVRHDDLCRNPRRGFEALFAALGWTWSEEPARFLAERDRPGEGFETMRVAAEQPEVWRRRLTGEQVAEAWDVLRRFRSPWVAEVEADLA